MSEMTVKDFAVKVGRDTSRLLEQMKDAGLPHKSEGDAVSEEDKQRLLDHLTKSHGGDGRAPKNRITLTRKTKSRIKSGDRGKTIEVQVRKKRTYVKRDEDEAAAKPEPVEQGPRQLVGDMADTQARAQAEEVRAAEARAAEARAAEEAAKQEAERQAAADKAETAEQPARKAPEPDVPTELELPDDEGGGEAPVVEAPPK
ncbi:translation initiation factor IF-2 associated domain-containing protein, partial [Halomonas sp. BBD48]|nr:translation initiation factor IF-2 associated domain-containing protein [Halomonas sp. BBD48]